LSSAFTPAAPVGDAELFTGRTDQVMRCISAIFQRGLHIVVYGERGVGKTSLANVLPKLIAGVNRPQLVAARVDCNVDDGFTSLWRKIFRELRADWRDEDGPIDPESVRFRLAKDGTIYLIVVDELDRLESDDALSLLADTVKTLSDHAVDATLMLVGVASSVEHLLGEHESIVRCVTQVPMPRMSAPELAKILDTGFSLAGMTAESAAKQSIVGMAEGLPHFVHVLGLESGRLVAEDERDHVTQADIERALRGVISSHTILSEYRRATQSPQTAHLFEEVLLACAMVPKDPLGYFRPGDVVGPLSVVLHRRVAIPNFARHLNELCTDARGNALLKEGKPHNFRYRFRNPLLQPFAKMVGLSRGLVDPEVLRRYPGPVPETSLLDWPNLAPSQDVFQSDESQPEP
jgi:energy-coupling factor transporter ATP-binding protein EcfA2